MYQTTISSVSGNMAADINGRSFYIAGSSIVTPRQQVWTDGKVIYGNTYTGGQSYIPIITGGIPYLTDSEKGIIRIYDRKFNHYKTLECSGIESIVNNDKYVYILKDGHWYGEKNIEYAGNDWYTLDACVNDKGDLLELGFDTRDNLQIGSMPFLDSYNDHKNPAPVYIRKNGEIIGEVDWKGFYNRYGSEAENLSSIGLSMLKGNPYYEKTRVTRQRDEIRTDLISGNVHPDGSWNVWITTKSNHRLLSVVSEYDIIHDRVSDEGENDSKMYEVFLDFDDLDAEGNPKSKIRDAGVIVDQIEGIAGASIVFDSENNTQIFLHNKETLLKATASNNNVNIYFQPFAGSKTYSKFYQPYVAQPQPYSETRHSVMWNLDEYNATITSNNSMFINECLASDSYVLASDYYSIKDNSGLLLYNYRGFYRWLPNHDVYTIKNGAIKWLEGNCRNYRLKYLKNINKLKDLLKGV